jgi:ATP-dependent DNA ligase
VHAASRISADTAVEEAIRDIAIDRDTKGVSDGIVLNAHYDGDGAAIYKHACTLGCEGIVSKRLGSPYRSGRVDHWLKINNPAAPAVQREAEEASKYA